MYLHEKNILNMNTKKSLISIIVPVYNVQDYLYRCVDSLLRQTYSNLEIILIDDGSTDRSLDMCKKFAEADARIKIISQPNKGIGAVRNIGLSCARGEYVAFVDSDDWVEPDMYELLLGVMVNECADIICCSHFRDKENKSDLSNVIGNNILTLTREEAFEALREEKFVLNFLWDKLFRREVLENIVFPEKRQFEDLIVSCHWLYNARKIIYLPLPKYHYSIRSGSLTNGVDTFNLKWRYEMVKALVEQNEFCVREGLWKKASGKLFRTCVHLLNRLIVLPSTPETNQMQAHCIAIIKQKDSVKGLGFKYAIKKFLITSNWKFYAWIYRLFSRKKQ